MLPPGTGENHRHNQTDVPHVRITVPTPTIGPKNVKYSLIAGADNVATVIPEDYPSVVKGVGSPTYGNLKDVVGVVQELGLNLES